MCRVAGITAVFDPDGSVRPCCVLPERLGNINQDEWEEIWTGEEASKIRQDIVQGKNPSCQHCGLYQKSSKQVYEGQDMDIKLQEIDLRISNRCNCRCVMCGPESSSQIMGELRELPIDRILPILEQNVHSITRIHFAGGEPLLCKDYQKVLKLFQEKEQMKYLTLSYNTNCTVFPGEEILQYWNNVYRVSVDLSIDGVGQVNDRIRVGSSWTKVQNVFKKFVQYREQNEGRVYLHIHPAVSGKNLGNLWELDRFAQTSNVPVRWGNCIDAPEIMSIWNLSQEEVEKRCKIEVERGSTREFREFIKGILITRKNRG